MHYSVHMHIYFLFSTEHPILQAKCTPPPPPPAAPLDLLHATILEFLHATIPELLHHPGSVSKI